LFLYSTFRVYSFFLFRDNVTLSCSNLLQILLHFGLKCINSFLLLNMCLMSDILFLAWNPGWIWWKGLCSMVLYSKLLLFQYFLVKNLLWNFIFSRFLPQMAKCYIGFDLDDKKYDNFLETYEKKTGHQLKLVSKYFS